MNGFQMVRQVVLIRWYDWVTDEDKQKVADALAGLASIPSVRQMRLGEDLGLRAGNFDFAVSVDFDDQAGYLAYRDHPEHKRVVEELIRPTMAERAGAVFHSP